MQSIGSPFHLAFFVTSIPEARQFYGDLLQCQEGRSTESWIDFNFFGNQITCHLTDRIPEPENCGKVDGLAVPIPHFGALIPRVQFQQTADRLREAKTKFLIEPQTRYEGQKGEQLTLFIYDPFGNAIELKSFSDPSEIFARN